MYILIVTCPMAYLVVIVIFIVIVMIRGDVVNIVVLVEVWECSKNNSSSGGSSSSGSSSGSGSDRYS